MRLLFYPPRGCTASVNQPVPVSSIPGAWPAFSGNSRDTESGKAKVHSRDSLLLGHYLKYQTFFLPSLRDMVDLLAGFSFATNVDFTTFHRLRVTPIDVIRFEFRQGWSIFSILPSAFFRLLSPTASEKSTAAQGDASFRITSTHTRSLAKITLFWPNGREEWGGY